MFDWLKQMDSWDHPLNPYASWLQRYQHPNVTSAPKVPENFTASRAVNELHWCLADCREDIFTGEFSCQFTQDDWDTLLSKGEMHLPYWTTSS